METFSKEQQDIFNKYISGKNIFVTGPGGCGKTFLIKYIVKDAKSKLKNIHICALTGCASILLQCNARTLHSWAGIGLANEEIDIIVNRVIRSKIKRQNWENVEILIIDEVSMLSLKIFKILDIIGRKIKKNDIPFGGIQLIFVGDFYQLPPIGNEDDKETSMFCFESEIWETVFGEPCFLETNFRQKDEKYNKILNQLRIGKIYSSSCKILQACREKKVDYENNPVILLPRRKYVDNINKTEYDKIDSKEYSYKIDDFYNLPEKYKNKENDENKYYSNEDKKYEIDYLKNNTMAEITLNLKIGTRVMCIANLDMESDKPIVNGSQGIIIDFENNMPKVNFDNGVIRIINKHIWASEKVRNVGISQVPLIYAWAITIHKSQGLTLEKAYIDVGSNIFEAGQSYVALSRIISLDGLFLKNFDPLKIKINRKVHNFYEKYRINHGEKKENI